MKKQKYLITLGPSGDWEEEYIEITAYTYSQAEYLALQENNKEDIVNIEIV